MDRLGVPRPHTDAFILTGPSQEPAYIAWVLCRRPRAADCIWLHAEFECDITSPRAACGRMPTWLGQKDEHCNWGSRGDCVSLAFVYTGTYWYGSLHV